MQEDSASTQPSANQGTPPPEVAPLYATAQLRELGEELATLYDQRDQAPTASTASDIERVRRQMRSGPRLQAGEFLGDGRYRLLEKLPTAGVDGKWKAWDRKEQHPVLVRVFYGQWVSDEEAIKAFIERGRALMALDTVGIGRTFQAAKSDDGFVYLATQLFETGSLETRSDLDAIAVTQVLLEAGRALATAHEKQLVHGAVQPDNVMITDQGSAHLVGFSVAPTDAAEATSLFRAPETTEKTYAPAPSSDVYALGMTAMAAFNQGELPFWVLRDPSRLIQSLPVSEAVKAVLLKATDWDLSIRYPTPTALIADLLADATLVEQLAVRARELERYEVAAEHYETLLTLAEHDDIRVEIQTTLGHVYTAQADYDNAHRHLVDALSATRHADALFGPLRTVAERTSDWAKLARDLWAQARSRTGPSRVAILTELARVSQYELQDSDRAAEAWDLVLEDHHLPAQALTALKALQSLAKARGDWPAYIKHTEDLLNYVPSEDVPRLQYAIGRAYVEQLHEAEKGLAFIDRAEALGWSEPDLSTTLQQVRAQMGQWPRVIQLMLDQAATQDLQQASPTLMRAGIVATAVHLEEDAFRVYHALLERAPRHVVALRHLARLHHRAHEEEQAIVYYEGLWEAYRGKPSEEPEASERAADCTAYAQLLLRAGRPEDATERVDEALRLNPNHVPSLQLAGPLYLALGQISRAEEAFRGILTIFKSVELSPHKMEACLGMGDISWMQGRLTSAMGWYNRAIELDPFSVAGWWGLAKVSLAARSGHPGAERAPWVAAVPKRYTANEALARVLAGLISPVSAKAWMQRSAVGKAFVEGGTTPMRLASGVVDMLIRHELITPRLFERLRAVGPGFGQALDKVEGLWFSGMADFDPIESYGWSVRVAAADFDPALHRKVLPATFGSPVVGLTDFDTNDAWSQLLTDPQTPPAPPSRLSSVDPAVELARRGPIVGFVNDGSLWGVFRQQPDQLVIGQGDDVDFSLPEDPDVRARHARVWRQGGRIYIEKVDDATVLVNGQATDRVRLFGGETLTIGPTPLQVLFVDQEHLLPSLHPTLAPASDRAEAPLGAEAPALERVSIAPPPPPPGLTSTVTPAEAPAPKLPDETPEQAPTVDEEDHEVVRTVAPPSEPAVAAKPESDLPETTSEDLSAPGPLKGFHEGVVPDPDPTPPPFDPAPTEDATAGPLDIEEIAPVLGDEPEPSLEEVNSRDPDTANLLATAPAWLRKALEDEAAAGDDVADSTATEAPPITPRTDLPDLPEVGEEDVNEVTEALAAPASSDDDQPEAMVGQAIDDSAITDEAPLHTPASPPPIPSQPPGDADGEAVTDPAWLEFMSGPDRGVSVPIGNQLTVGQSELCGMSVPTDTRLSPTHCIVQRTARGFVLRDAGSTTGTVVNGQRVQETVLGGGETIMVGRTVLRFRIEDPDGD
ncbi:MAG: FHA domain-containing protein [Myxococcota bacterium]